MKGSEKTICKASLSRQREHLLSWEDRISTPSLARKELPLSTLQGVEKKCDGSSLGDSRVERDGNELYATASHVSDIELGTICK